MWRKRSSAPRSSDARRSGLHARHSVKKHSVVNHSVNKHSGRARDTSLHMACDAVGTAAVAEVSDHISYWRLSWCDDCRRGE